MNNEKLLKLLRAAREKKVLKLNFVQEDIAQLPEEIGELVDLRELWLLANNLTSLPNSIGNLLSLEQLWLHSNRLRELPDSIGRLEKLRELTLHFNRLVRLPESIGRLINLEEFLVQKNCLKQLPTSIGQLLRLEELSLHDNELSSLPESIGQLSSLRHLSLDDNLLTNLPDSIGSLSRVEALSIDNNHLSSLPRSIGKLSRLKQLYLNNNKLESVPDSIGQLADLESLWLNNNQLTSLPDSIGNLTKLWDIRLYNNPLTDPPPAIREQGVGAILSYLREKIETGEKKQWISKMLFVGEGGVGKTQLLRRLRGEPFQAQSETTHGIEVQTLHVPHPTQDDVTMTLNCWDFGGQQIYHATHQFFLTGRSLFLLCWNARTGHEQSKLDYWLDTIQSLAPDAPVMLVATHIDQRDAKLPYDGLKKKYPQISGQWSVSNLSDDGLHDLKAAIQKTAADQEKLPLMGQSWPNSYIKSAEAVRAVQEKELTIDNLFEIFHSNKVDEQKSQETLARFLHDLGELLWFHDDEELKEIVLLDPEWVDQRVSDVLECQAVIDGHGIFRREHMKQVWPDVSEPMQERLLRLMEKFDLSYVIPDDREDKSLVVERLSEDPPTGWDDAWNALHPDNGHREVSMRWELNMRRPAGVPTWFIARSHRFTTHTHWLYGAVFADNRDPAKRKHLALVEAPPSERYVELTVRGPSPHAFFVLLKDGLELTLERFPGMMQKLVRKVRCPGHNGQICGFQFDFNYLEKAMLREPPVLEVQCQSAFEHMSVPGLLMGIHWSADNEITRRIREAEDNILAGQHEMKEQLTALQELTQLEFSKLFARDQRYEESHTPAVFTLRPKGKREWARKLTGETFQIQLWCEQPGNWHWHKEWPAYEISDPAIWLETLAPHLQRIFKVLRFAAPIAGPLTGYAFKEYEDLFKYDIALMKSLVDGFDKLDIDFDTDDDEMARYHRLQYRLEFARVGDERGEGASLLYLRRMLDTVAPDWQNTCGLRKILTPENHYLWLCPEHAKEYLI